MFHTITFVADCTVDLEIAPKKPLQRLQIREGERRCVQIRPYVAEIDGELIEVADLLFGDNTFTRCVAFSAFRLAD